MPSAFILNEFLVSTYAKNVTCYKGGVGVDQKSAKTVSRII